jgi:rhodanese-related sulfurtransferase
MTSSSSSSLVTEHGFAAPAEAEAHFRAKLTFETDPSDVQADLAAGGADFVVVDARSADAYGRAHVPGAINIPYRQMTQETLSRFAPTTHFVVYCDGVQCNASTKGALRLSALGFRVKEMMGGLDGWVRDGFPVEPASNTRDTAPSCGCA